MTVDPWSLGPDIFAHASQSHKVEEDLQRVEQSESTVQNEPEVDSMQSGQGMIEKETLLTVELSDLPISTEPMAPAHSIIDTFFTVQLGTFLDQTRAQELYDRASQILGINGTIQSDWPFYRLRFGQFPHRISADSLNKVAMSRGFYDARVLKITSSR